jgi:hypothetical protein
MLRGSDDGRNSYGLKQRSGRPKLQFFARGDLATATQQVMLFGMAAIYARPLGCSRPGDD